MTRHGFGKPLKTLVDLLRAHGWTEAQGFLFGRATTAGEARAFLAKRRRKIGNAA
jgi:EAL domain-containing protein (putative c-di-GMP-specific phosphodiesterase class I)